MSENFMEITEKEDFVEKYDEDSNDDGEDRYDGDEGDYSDDGDNESDDSDDEIDSPHEKGSSYMNSAFYLLFNLLINFIWFAKKLLFSGYFKINFS